MRDIPYRERKQKKTMEEDATVRAGVVSGFGIPDGTKDFKFGYRECIEMFALHAPNKRGIARILDDHCVHLENACLRNGMARDKVSEYEGYRQAMKDLAKMKKIR